jgi:hypothetical protein
MTRPAVAFRNFTKAPKMDIVCTNCKCVPFWLMRIRPSMQVLQLSKFIYRDLSCLRKVAQYTDSLLIFTICTFCTTYRASHNNNNNNNNTMQCPHKSKSTWQLHILSTYSTLPIIKYCSSNAKSADRTHKKTKQNRNPITNQALEPWQ